MRIGQKNNQLLELFVELRAHEIHRFSNASFRNISTDGTSEYSIMHAINGGKYPSIKSSVQNLPEGLDEIVHRALSKDPSKRFQSAKEMLAAIHQTIQHPEIAIEIDI